MKDSAMASFVSEYSTVLLKLDEHTTTRFELTKELRAVEKAIKSLESDRRRLDRKFADFLLSLKEA